MTSSKSITADGDTDPEKYNHFAKTQSWKFHFIQQPRQALHLRATPIYQIQECEKDSKKWAVMSDQWAVDATAAFTSFDLKINGNRCISDGPQKVILILSCFVEQCRPFGKLLEEEEVIKTALKGLNRGCSGTH